MHNFSTLKLADDWTTIAIPHDNREFGYTVKWFSPRGVEGILVGSIIPRELRVEHLEFNFQGEGLLVELASCLPKWCRRESLRKLVLDGTIPPALLSVVEACGFEQRADKMWFLNLTSKISGAERWAAKIKKAKVEAKAK